MAKERLRDKTYRRKPRNKQRDREYSRSYYKRSGVKEHQIKYVRQYRTFRHHLDGLLAQLLLEHSGLSLEQIVDQVAKRERIRPRLETIKPIYKLLKKIHREKKEHIGR